MKIEYTLEELEKIRYLLFTYPSNMDLKHFFNSINGFIQSNKNIYFQDLSVKKVIDTKKDNRDEWIPIIRKSTYINSLFEKLDYICVQDQNF